MKSLVLNERDFEKMNAAKETPREFLIKKLIQAGFDTEMSDEPKHEYDFKNYIHITRRSSDRTITCEQR